MIELVTGDLLSADVDALVNPVNCVGVMGKGLALQFKRAFPDMERAYAAEARAGRIVPGKMHVWASHRPGQPRFIINFPTKRHWRERSRLDDIEAGLADLVRVVRDNGLVSLALPPLGAGNGRLEWPRVRALIEAELACLADVQVLLFEPGAAPRGRERVVRTRRPKMTLIRALLVDVMARYGILGEPLSLLEAQKLAYLLEQAGAPLDLRFVAHVYGPYSDRLFHALRDMEGHQLAGIDDRKPGSVLALLDGAAQEARDALAGHEGATGWAERVAQLIEGFESPYGMELLATVHWQCKDDAESSQDFDACLQKVHGWNERKRRLLRPPHLEVAWRRLCEQRWLAA